MTKQVCCGGTGAPNQPCIHPTGCVTRHGRDQGATQMALDAFILHAGYSYGWQQLDTHGRRMAEQAVIDITALKAEIARLHDIIKDRVADTEYAQHCHNLLHIDYEAACRARDFATNALPNWVPVSERMPAVETPVLIMHNGVIKIAQLCWDNPGFEDTYSAYQYWEEQSVDTTDLVWDYITHWMPLPEEPSELETCAFCGIKAESVCDVMPPDMCEQALNATFGSPTRPVGDVELDSPDWIDSVIGGVL